MDSLIYECDVFTVYRMYYQSQNNLNVYMSRVVRILYESQNKVAKTKIINLISMTIIVN